MTEPTNDPKFLWSLQVFRVEDEGKEFFEFFIEKDEEIVAEGKANGFFSIVDQALEAVYSWGLTPKLGQSASLVDLAFNTGVLVERRNAEKLIDEQIERLEKERAELVKLLADGGNE
jgi:hypothetical protein